MSKETTLRDVATIDGIFDPREALAPQIQQLQDSIQAHYDRSDERWIDYILAQYFSKIPKEEIDYAYIRDMI
jgi:hypothetical protein